jgi:hypothetical protein
MTNPKNRYKIAEEIVTVLLTTSTGTGTRLAVKGPPSNVFLPENDFGGWAKSQAINEVNKILKQYIP